MITPRPSICVLVPVLRRPKNVRPLVESFVENSSPDSSLLFIVEGTDEAELLEISRVLLDSERRYIFENVSFFSVPERVRRWSQKLNEAYRYDHDAYRVYEDAHSPSDWYLLGADDLRFHKGWDDNRSLFTIMADPTAGVIGTNDMGNASVVAGNHSTHPLMRSAYVREQGIMEAAGVIAPECYFHNFTDNEIVGTARQRNAYRHCHESKIEHLHPVWGKAAKDEVYDLGAKRYAYDNALFSARRRLYGWM